MAEAAEGLWVVLSRVNDGDWSKQSAVWRASAAHARDFYFALLHERLEVRPVET